MLYRVDRAKGKTLTMIALTIATKSEVDKGFSKSTLVGMTCLLFTSLFTEPGFLKSSHFQYCPTGKSKLRITASQPLCPLVSIMALIGK